MENVKGGENGEALEAQVAALKSKLATLKKKAAAQKTASSDRHRTEMAEMSRKHRLVIEKKDSDAHKASACRRGRGDTATAAGTMEHRREGARVVGCATP